MCCAPPQVHMALVAVLCSACSHIGFAYAKANPGKINMGSGGIGSTGHVAGALFNMMTGLTIALVPYRGEAPAMTDLLAGQVQIVFTTPGSAMSYVKAG